jgi:hypothetical protein
MIESLFGDLDFIAHPTYFIVGVATIMLAIVWAYYHSFAYRGWRVAEGVVEKAQNIGAPGTFTEGANKNQRVFFVNYEVGGETYQTSFRHPFLRAGKKVGIRYDPESPNVGEVLDTPYGKYGAQFVVATFGALLILVSLDSSVYPF